MDTVDTKVVKRFKEITNHDTRDKAAYAGRADSIRRQLLATFRGLRSGVPLELRHMVCFFQKIGGDRTWQSPWHFYCFSCCSRPNASSGGKVSRPAGMFLCPSKLFSHCIRTSAFEQPSGTTLLNHLFWRPRRELIGTLHLRRPEDGS